MEEKFDAKTVDQGVPDLLEDLLVLYGRGVRCAFFECGSISSSLAF